MLYSHRNPGEDVAQAVSTGGATIPNCPTHSPIARRSIRRCSCKGIGQTWADALKHLDDQTVERGDIVVNEERAKLLSQPQTDAQGKPIKPPPPTRASAPAPKGKAAAPVDAAAEDKAADGDHPVKRQVRTVGPTFLPVR